ncbi:MAG: apolipoprotein N-acyltransferase [Pyrinomonadaceae bacterium]
MEVGFVSKCWKTIRGSLPGWRLAGCSLLSGLLLAAAFPGWEISVLAFVAFIPLILAILDEPFSFVRSFLAGWLFGVCFFSLSVWWLTFAPITYAGFPVILTYFLLLIATSVVSIFFGFAVALFGLAVRRYGITAVWFLPFIWVALEFLRLNLTGNSWNTVGYSQAFGPLVRLGALGGVNFVSFLVMTVNAGLAWPIAAFLKRKSESAPSIAFAALGFFPIAAISGIAFMLGPGGNTEEFKNFHDTESVVVALQPNIPMSGLNMRKWGELRARQAEIGKKAIRDARASGKFPVDKPVTLVFPESPMNFQYEEDLQFQTFINDFARNNDVSVLFNSAEPDRRREYGYFNSAVLVSKGGKKLAQYDKIHLLPFGEFVPLPEFAQELIPPMVGRFSFGEEYDLLPFGNAKAGIMICFESHFASLSREFVKNGADLLVEMTNDGYLGPTPVLRQHLASAAFRAAETRRPLLRVTNVGITGYIDEFGAVSDTAKSYSEAVRVWPVRKSTGEITPFVRFGEWIAWFSLVLTVLSLPFLLRRFPKPPLGDEAVKPVIL